MKSIMSDDGTIVTCQEGGDVVKKIHRLKMYQCGHRVQRK